MPDIVHVAVAVIVNEDDEVCISLRHEDSHQGGLWEFPGGKIEPGETVEQALLREIKEELDLDIKESRPLITIPHNYQDKAVCLHVNRVQGYYGQATGVEGQQVKWVPVNELSSYEFPAANLSIIKALQLPDKYLITGKFINEDNFLRKLKNALNRGIQLVQLRLKEGDLNLDEVPALVQQVSSLCADADVNLLFNIPQKYLNLIDMPNIRFDGFHADSKTLKTLLQRPAGRLFSASCHNEEELIKAKQLNADFVVLSPVQKTASHPEMQAMGWPQFSELIENITLPVYALGGVSEEDLEVAWQCGAQGIAAISALWESD
jgi:8-oxo-dGTP diphosphatase